MVFSMLDKDRCMAYKPVILSNKFKTFHITIDGNKAVGNDENNLISERLQDVGYITSAYTPVRSRP